MFFKAVAAGGQGPPRFRQTAQRLGSEKVNLYKQYSLDLQYTGTLYKAFFMTYIQSSLQTQRQPFRECKHIQKSEKETHQLQVVQWTIMT